jgi:hypothetical protein
MAAMSRVLVLVQRPYHLNEEEAERWLSSQADQFAELDGVNRVELTRLESASWKFAREGDWLLELHLEPTASAHRILNGPTCVALLGDLRVLGMRPAVAVVGTSDAASGAS